MLKSVKIGDVVRHLNDELGVGEVIEVTDDNIKMRFAQGRVTLKAAVALPLLQLANRADLPAATRAKARRATAPVAPANGCEACKALHRSQVSRDGKWKSCPTCAKQSIRLASGRGHRLTRGVCTFCKLPAAPVWRYKNSDAAEIVLCSRCREAPLKRFRKRSDALNRSTGGAFESNRRRH